MAKDRLKTIVFKRSLGESGTDVSSLGFEIFLQKFMPCRAWVNLLLCRMLGGSSSGGLCPLLSGFDFLVASLECSELTPAL